MNEELLHNQLDAINENIESILHVLLISSREAVLNFKKEINNDLVLKEIILVSKGIPYSEVLSQVAEKTGVSERTVSRRISELRNIGAIRSIREGSAIVLYPSKILE